MKMTLKWYHSEKFKHGKTHYHKNNERLAKTEEDAGGRSWGVTSSV